METIIDREFGGERPLYNRHGLRLERVTIHAGESSIKEGSDIEARNCRFEGKYVFWCCEDFLAADCHFTEGARSSLWHSRRMELRDCRQEAPKMFRESADIRLRRVSMPHAQETFWSCEGIDIEDVEAHEADYIFMNCSDIKVRNFKLFGNYAFQHARNVEIHDSDLQTKDSFWESENVTVYDSFINGEYLLHLRAGRRPGVRILRRAGHRAGPRRLHQEPAYGFDPRGFLRRADPRQQHQGAGRLPHRDRRQTYPGTIA